MSGWQVGYHYGDEADAQNAFKGYAKAYDRADKLELIAPDGEVVDTMYVTHDAARADGFATRDEDGRGVPVAT